MVRFCKKDILKCIFTISILCLFLTGCKGDVIASYEYTTPETVKNLSVTGADYTDEALYIYVSGADAGKITECTCFDKNCQTIKCGWKLSAGRSRIVIKGANAKDISGVTLYLTSEEEYKIRYLDSNQCAMLYGTFVCDIGTEYTGDTERFKSDAERAMVEQRKQAKKDACEAAYSFLEGMWCSKNNSSHYISAYSNDSVHMLNICGDEYVFDYFEDAVITSDGDIQITLSGDGWEQAFDFLFLDIKNDSVMHSEDTFYRVNDDALWDTGLFGFNPEILFLYDSNQYTDFNDEESLKCSLRTTINSRREEILFINTYSPDSKTIGEYKHPLAQVFVYEKDDEIDFVFFISQSENSSYPKTAQFYRLYANNMQPEAVLMPSTETDGEKSLLALNGADYVDENYLLNPYQDKYEYIDTLDDNGKLIKQEYTSNVEEYGTYDSSGVIFYDDNEYPFYKYYYVTSGSRFTFYLRDNGNINWICDIGGMAYSAMEGNDDVEVGMLFKIYRFG